MTERRRIFVNEPVEKAAGYARAVVDGRDIFVSGTTGYEHPAMEMPEDVVDQVHGCFRNISAALEQADASLEDVVRVTYIVTSAEHVDRVLPVFTEYFGEILPASTLFVAGLARPEMKVEIEVTARRRG